MEKRMPMILRQYGEAIDTVNFQTNVAGITFAENSNEILKLLKEKVQKENIRLRLTKEEFNEFDSNAVRVDISIVGSKRFYKIGYIPRDKNELLSYVLSFPEKYNVFISNVNVVGGDYGKNYGVYFNYNVLTKDDEVNNPQTKLRVYT